MCGTWPIIQTLYDILYVDVDQLDVEETEDDGLGMGMEEQKEAKEWIRGEHYLQISRLAERAGNELTAPQWIQCTECKQWRVIPVAINQIVGGQWMKKEWRCSVDDGLEEGCGSKQETPSKRTHSEQEVAILRLQRKWMNARYSKDAESVQTLREIEQEMKGVLEALKAETAYKLKDIGDAEMAEARFIGIGQWNGYSGEDDEQSICRFYEFLVSSFREWRMESLKTLMDHFGFLVEQRKKDKDTGSFKVTQIALSHSKEKVVAKLATFLMFPIESALQLKTADFSQ